MKLDAVALLTLVTVVTTKTTTIEDLLDFEDISAYGYHSKIGIPLADKIRQAEAKQSFSNIVLVSHGSAARLGEIPYQAGILADLTNGRKSACGGSLLNAGMVLTAAHCWFDGVIQSWRFIIVLGSITLFSGGQRFVVFDTIVHHGWRPRLAANDIALIRLPSPVIYTVNVAPIPLPSGSDINETFAGYMALASGFGATRERGKVSPTLNQVNLPVISNAECMRTFPHSIRGSNICTSGAGGRSSCGGDSGGPLVVWKNSRRILIGITSFGHSDGCQHGYPVVFTRVSSYVNWINNFLQ